MPSLTEDLRFRGVIHQITDEAILPRLDSGGVTAYIGFDPTARSLHIGSLLQLVTLRRLQLAGNRPIVLAGGGTGLIGDPGGRTEERKLLSEAELAGNIAGVREQLARFLDFSSGAGSTTAVLVDNAAWLTTIPLTDFLREVGKHFTVNQMIAKESVRSRLDRVDGGISYTEFSYMLLQAYDFYRLHVDFGCDLQLGGSDQWGNITLAVEYVRKMTGDQAFGITTPLLTKSDGTKLGKSTLTNEHVWLDRAMTSPYQLYQFFVNLEDSTVGTMLRALTFLGHDEIQDLEARAASAPAERAAQRRLAYELVCFVHSETDAQAAAAASGALFDDSLFELAAATLDRVTEFVPSASFDRVTLEATPVVELLAESGLCTSLSDARRAVDQGGIYVNNERVADGAGELSGFNALQGRYYVVRRGKKNIFIAVVR